jgi:hypothetical protein
MYIGYAWGHDYGPCRALLVLLQSSGDCCACSHSFTNSDHICESEAPVSHVVSDADEREPRRAEVPEPTRIMVR